MHKQWINFYLDKISNRPFWTVYDDKLVFLGKVSEEEIIYFGHLSEKSTKPIEIIPTNEVFGAEYVNKIVVDGWILKIKLSEYIKMKSRRKLYKKLTKKYPCFEEIRIESS